MKVEIHKDVKELLKELNEIAPSMIYGGYLRSLYLNQVPNDVDIITEIPIDILEEKYSQLDKAKRRTTVSGYDMYSFKLHRTEKIFVEIVSTKEDLFNKAHHADYTINSLLHNGDEIIDLKNAFKDMQDKIIREVDKDIIIEDLKSRPFLWTKTIRLVSSTGFNLSDLTFNILNNNKDCIKIISSEIMQSEGHKTLSGKDPIKALKLLAKMKLIQPFIFNKDFEDISNQLQSHQKMCLLAILTSKQTIDDYAKLYCFKEDLIERYNELFEAYHSKDVLSRKNRNQVVTLRNIIKRID